MVPGGARAAPLGALSQLTLCPVQDSSLLPVFPARLGAAFPAHGSPRARRAAPRPRAMAAWLNKARHSLAGVQSAIESKVGLEVRGRAPGSAAPGVRGGGARAA